MNRKQLLFVVVFGFAVFALAGAGSVFGQAGSTGTPAPPKVSPDEAKLAQKIEAAPDAASKLTAAVELINKYPKTNLRSQVVREIANQIEQVPDATQKLTLAQQFQAAFNDPADEESVMPVLIDALADANQFDQAFAKGSEFLTRHPDSLVVLVQLLSIGTDQAKRQNPKFADQAIRYGAQIITMVETNQKPANYDEPSWQQFKTNTLPSIYQSMGLLYLTKGARADAKTHYTKAAQLAPSDPFNTLMLAAILNEDYQNEVKAHQAMPSGAEKQTHLKKVETLLDSVIDAYARAIAVSESTAALQQVRQQYLQDLEMYYKYRHNGSTEGMQQLIDKHKAAPKP